jgi:hypothetical protein
MKRQIKLIPEFNSSSLWEMYDDGSEDISPEDLPISGELQRDLTRWGETYQAIFDEDYPPDSAFPSLEAESDFKREGRELCRRLAAELKDAADVTHSPLLDDAPPND